VEHVSYETLQVRLQDSICFVRLDRPEANNTINQRLVEECHQVLDACETSATVVVFSGNDETFCFGADFQDIRDRSGNGQAPETGPDRLYDLWMRMASGPYITVSHVRGKANAGGIGFVAASDVVLADETAKFSLSELLFGVIPACVLPFLVRRVGFQRAHYLTLMTQPITVQQAHDWGLVDAWEPNSEALLRRHLLRLRRLSGVAIGRYKRYANQLGMALSDCRQVALAANAEVFSDPRNIDGIVRYVERGVFPWEI
jgi:polyketide biosynthesis enoyl-CoA hydratase PksH